MARKPPRGDRRGIDVETFDRAIDCVDCECKFEWRNAPFDVFVRVGVDAPIEEQLRVPECASDCAEEVECRALVLFEDGVRCEQGTKGPKLPEQGSSCAVQLTCVPSCAAGEAKWSL